MWLLVKKICAPKINDFEKNVDVSKNNKTVTWSCICAYFNFKAKV